MAKLRDIDSLVNFSDFPFDHTLTSDSYDSLVSDTKCVVITGWCAGDIIGMKKEVFFRAAVAEGIQDVLNEYNILTQLQCYDFVPRVYCVRDIGRYTILFTEKIDGVDLDSLRPINLSKVKYAIKQSVRLLYNLYCELGFVHRDLHFGNILIDNNDKVYIIDFTSSEIPSTLSNRSSWAIDIAMLMSLKNYILIRGSVDTELYLEYVKKIESGLYDETM